MGDSQLVKCVFQGVAFCVLAGVGLMPVRPASACNVPVFRYALERWAPDPYEVVVFHRGALSKGDETAVREFESLSVAESGSANFVVRLVDVDAPEEEADLALMDQQGGSQLPWVVVRYPTVSKLKATVWSGPMTASAIRVLVDSPARQEIGKRLIGGHSAVWVFVESGDSAKDDDTAKVLEGELAGMAEKVELPEGLGAGDPLGALDAATQVPLSFSMIRVSREDEREKIFLDMLLRSESDLEDLDEPMAFPVFGRGRALYALVGAGINAENIREACAFLAGPCSCQVKTENPGVDVLMQVAWEDEVKTIWTDETLDTSLVASGDPPTPVGDVEGEDEDRDARAGSVLAAGGGSGESAPQQGQSLRTIVMAGDGGHSGSDGGGTSAVMRNLLIGLILGVFGVAGATVVVMGKAKKQTGRASTN